MATVKQYELYHGIVLTRLLRSDQAINVQLVMGKPTDSWCAYLINNRVALFVKRSTKAIDCKGGRMRWSFTFSVNQLCQMIDYTAEKHNYELCLVLVASHTPVLQEGEDVAICLLEHKDVTELLDFNAKGSVSVRVSDIPKKHSYKVTGGHKEVSVGKKNLEKWDIPPPKAATT